jgi:hypothetical protein
MLCIPFPQAWATSWAPGTSFIGTEEGIYFRIGVVWSPHQFMFPDALIVQDQVKVT